MLVRVVSCKPTEEVYTYKIKLSGGNYDLRELDILDAENGYRYLVTKILSEDNYIVQAIELDTPELTVGGAFIAGRPTEVDNFDVIRDLLDFRSDDDYYFLQVLQRKKDHRGDQKVNGCNNNSRLVKAYYVKSLDHFDFIRKEVIQLCKVFNARAGINLNKRSFERTQLRLLQKVTDQIVNKTYNKGYKAYPSVAGAMSSSEDKRWILDVDYGWNPTKYSHLGEYINSIAPEGDKVIAEIPSKNGYHLITKPFNLKVFRGMGGFSSVEVHKNNPTNLYIPRLIQEMWGFGD